MKRSLRELEVSIHIQNEYNRVANIILEDIKEKAKQFIGKKIVTQKGLSSKFYDVVKFDRESIAVTPIKGTKWANVHYASVRSSYNDLSIEITLCFSDGNVSCFYEKRTWYFGKVSNEGVFEKFTEHCKVDTTPLVLETELQSIKNYLELENALEAAKRKINLSSDVYKYLRLEDL